jgi:hypothetical protein
MLVTTAKRVKFVRSRADYLRNTAISWKAARAQAGDAEPAADGGGCRAARNSRSARVKRRQSRLVCAVEAA